MSDEGTRVCLYIVLEECPMLIQRMSCCAVVFGLIILFSIIEASPVDPLSTVTF
jgi:hypothetical protein